MPSVPAATASHEPAWDLVAQAITGACVCPTGQGAVIRQVPLPHTVHALRCVLHSAFTAAHNLPLIALVFLVVGVTPGREMLLALLGLGLLALNTLAASLLLGMLCARFG